MIELIVYGSVPQSRQSWQWLSGIETKLLGGLWLLTKKYNVANGALCLSTHKHNDKSDTGYLSIISDGSLSTQYDVAHFFPAGFIFLYR
jgi:hypothetical protein